MIDKRKWVVVGVSLTGLAILLGSSQASAGEKLPPEPVYVNLTSRTAVGGMGDARNSSNSVEFIGCLINGTSTGVQVTCSAKDAQGVAASCTTTSAALADVVHAFTSDAYISFMYNSSGTCTRITSHITSQIQPKLP